MPFYITQAGQQQESHHSVSQGGQNMLTQKGQFLNIIWKIITTQFTLCDSAGR